MAALEPMHHDAQRPEIDVVGTQQPDLACAQPMTVGDQEQRAVAWTGPHNGEQPGELLKGEEPDRLVGAR
jgi:hypothetical protein